MRVMILSLVLCSAVWSQSAHVTFQPVPLAVSEEMLGRGPRHQYGLWRVLVDGVLPGWRFSSSRILQLAPGVTALGNRQALALMDRIAYSDRRSKTARFWDGFFQLAPTGLGVAGMAAKSPGYGWAAIGISVGGLVVVSLRRVAPDPGKVIGAEDLLPETVDRDGSWYIVTGLVHGAAAIGPLEIK